MADQINITVVENVEVINITVSTSVPNIIVEVAEPGGGGGGAVDSVNGQTGAVVLTTTNINEGSNLYFTTARAIAALATTLLNYVTNSNLANTLLNYATTLQLADKQDKRIVVSSNTTAVIDGAYTLVANATFTDPAPQEGKGFSVLIRNGTATIGGTTYSIAGTIVWRVFHSGTWANYVNELFITPGTTAQYYRGDKTFQTLDKTAVGLGNVPNLDTSTTANITDSSNKRFVTDANLTVIGNTSGTNTGNETAASIGAIVNGATNYTTPQDADKIGILDVANALFKALTWANLKATLKTYFDTIYTTTAAVASQISTALTGYATESFVKSSELIAIQCSGAALNPSDATTYYFSDTPTLAPGATATARKLILPVNCTLFAARIETIVGGTLAGGNESSTVSFRVNNTTDHVISSAVKYTAAAQTLLVTGLNVAVTPSDDFQLKLLTATFATNPTTTYIAATLYFKLT
jgi:hypothetical protein